MAGADPGAEDAGGGPRPFLHLSDACLQFSPVDGATSVFFDEANQQVFTVREGATNVSVCSMRKDHNVNLSFPNRGPVISMKFSLDQNTLAIQRTPKTIQFVNLNGKDSSEYSQSCKSKASIHLLGFNWTHPREIVLITNQGIELYQVNTERRSLKMIKSYNLSINWFVYSHESKVVLLSSSPQANIIHPYLFKRGSIQKLAKFEVELPAMYNQLSQKLLERDVTVASIYGRLYVLLVKNNPKTAQGPRAEISVCLLTRDGAIKTDILVLDMNGRFAINVVDNLVLVHHQTSKTSTVFDIKYNQQRPKGSAEGAAPAGGSAGAARSPTIHNPIVEWMSIRPVAGPVRDDDSKAVCELYSPSWIVFQPNIVIDAKLGALWTVSVQLQPLVDLIPDKSLVIDLLLRRKSSKDLLLGVIRRALEPGTQAKLPTIAAIFDQLNAVCAAARSRGDVGAARDGKQQTHGGYQIIDQSDMYERVFEPLEDEVDDVHIPYKFLVAVQVEYIRSLNQFKIPVEHFLYKLIINKLVRHNRYYQLHQFLQYHVVNDSKHVACLLLSLEQQYPPAFQLSLDMMKRLSNANEEIFEGLLLKDHLLPALRFVRSMGPEAIASVSARRFLDAALNTNDPMLFYTVFKFFEERNIQLRRKPDFAAAEGCDKFVLHFQKMFG